MKTQLSRQSFKAEQRYSGVFQQMGRMITDADWNELTELLQYEVSDALADVVGSGSPRKRGIVVEVAPGDYRLRWGHLYAEGYHGVLTPQPEVFSTEFVFHQQADFPGLTPLAEGQYRLYADVWDRSVMHLEDPGLLDTALKGADTATRTQRMAQIKACPPDISAADLEGDTLLNPAVGTLPLDLAIRQGQTLKDPCDPCAEELALQDKVGNYLFRVEVHDVTWQHTDGHDPELVGLVLKWSSENGAEQYRVGAVPPGFESANWCYEFYPDTSQQMITEKHLGHHLLPGFSPSRGALVSGYPASEPEDLVRRWDGFAVLRKAAGNWVLDEGADRGRELSTGYSETAHGHLDLGDPLHINLDALELTLDLADGVALAGDYWLATVREAKHNPGDLLLEGALPEGVRHHYWSLGVVTVDDAGNITGFEPDPDAACTAHGFPPLTDIQARDVCYDNDACDMPEVKSVQDAIDYLCKAKDLRWHHKHLHGMGVVCGLVVQCGSDTNPSLDNDEAPRRHVKITKGAALDCEGNILELDATKEIDLIARVERLLEERSDALQNGRGNVCLWIEQGSQGQPRLRIEPFTDQGQSNLLDGTLWMDFYQHCIKDLADEFQGLLREMQPGNDEGATDRVSEERKKATTLLNLVAHFFYGEHGRKVFVSRKEHDILRAFYLRMRGLLQSKAFCGMYQGQDFPDYFDNETRISTVFGKNHHEKLLLHPSDAYVLTYQGTDTTVNSFDLEAENLVQITEVRGGEGANVTAMAFSPDGEDLYAATAINANDALLTRGQFKEGTIKWDKTVVVCGVHATELFFLKGDNLLYMVGRGRGVYELNLRELFDDEKIFPQPRWSFNATGQVAHSDDFGGVIYALAAAPNADGNATSEPEHYDRIVWFSPDQGSDNAQNDIPLGGDLVGEDDLALTLSRGNRQGGLYVVVNQPENRKALFRFSLNGADIHPKGVAIHRDLASTDIRLCSHPDRNRDAVLLTLQDEFRAMLIDSDGSGTDRLPVQLMPSAIAAHTLEEEIIIEAGNHQKQSGKVVILNHMSNTLTLYPVNELATREEFVGDLEDYRQRVFMAFLALFGNLLQHLKDCFCNHLLIKCPSCDDDDKVYLAKVEIRDNKVYKICNFGKRRDVWTFPKVEYWLSIVPIIPMIKQTVARLCCRVLPNLFAPYMERMNAREKYRAAPSGNTYKAMVHTSKTFNGERVLKDNQQRVQTNVRLASDAVMFQRQREVGASIGKLHYQNLPVEQTREQLQQKNITVAEVVHYDKTHSKEALRHYSRTPDRIPEGSEVVVYEEQGKTLFYAVKSTPTQRFDTAAAEAQLGQLQQRKEQVVADIHKARSELQTMEQRKRESEQQLGKLQQDFQRMAQQRQAMQTEMQALTTQFGSLRDELQMMKVEVVKERPVKEAMVVTEEEATKLNALGVRNVGDLEKVDKRVLVERGGLDDAKADQLMVEFQRLTTFRRM
ncbi:MAG: DUF6519 domain-containing protein [Saccharospirillum sp.]